MQPQTQSQTQAQWMIYGATGSTGRLIPILATSRPMLDACLEAGAHYLDITGEIDVFESVFARAGEIRARGIAAIPGVGFDVVPTDCLAAELKRRLPDARELALGFRSDGRMSPGTAKSALEGIALGGRVRQGGKLTRVPVAARSREIDFKGNGRPSHAILSPWGDVATAYHSTGIPEIEFYIASPRGSEWPMRVMAQVMRAAPVRKLAQKAIGRWVAGPGSDELEHGRCWIWGEARGPRGELVALRMELPEGYRFTISSSLACVRRVLDGQVKAGAWTPSMAFGAGFVLSIEGAGGFQDATQSA
jgi:short subunit dehydrogenase-like uncharacterized protein